MLALLGALVIGAVAVAKTDFGGKWNGGAAGRQAEGVTPPSRITFRVDNNNVVKDFSWTRWSYYCEDQQATYEIEPYTMQDKAKLVRDGKQWEFGLIDTIEDSVSFTVIGTAKPAPKDRPKEGATAKGYITFNVDLPGGLCNNSPSTPEVRWEADQQG